MKKLFLLVPLLLLLTACPHPQTLSQHVLTGYALLNDYADRTEVLVDARAISKSEAESRLNLIRTTKTSLDVARAALKACRATATADDDCKTLDGTSVKSLTAATRLTLKEFEKFLIEREAKR